MSESPFAPTSVRVFPLTRFDRNSAGQPVLVLHVEFRDANGDSVKGAGQMTVKLYRRYTAAAAADVTWTVDLRDLTLNAQLYDAATQTYAVPLGGLPAWSSAFASASAVESEAAGPPPTVDVVVEIDDPDAEVRMRPPLQNRAEVD